MATRTGSRSFFDRWSVTYDRADFQRFTYKPLHDAVLGRLRDAHPTRVIDLGCGTGRLTSRLARRFPEAAVVGADLSSGMLGEASARRARGPRSFGLVRCDAQQLPFAEASADLLVCTESFHWYRDQRGAVEEVARTVRVGGQVLIASIATITPAGARLLRRASAVGGNQVRALPPRQLRNILEVAGFEVTHQRRIPRFGPPVWPVLTEARRR